MNQVEKIFEGFLWNSRFVVVAAVVSSILGAFALFYMTTVDAYYMISHLLHYASPALDSAARVALRSETVTHVVEIVDGFLLATFLLIFGMGLYELFISKIDQAEETLIDDVSVLKASRRMSINGKPLPFRGLWTANPANCWLKADFIDTPKPNHYFVQALPGDNNYLPSSYIETLKASFGHRPELLQAYLYGSWDSFEGSDQVILGDWVRRARGIPPLIVGDK